MEQSNKVETTEVPAQHPSARTNFSICAIDDTIFFFGGEFFNGSRTEVYGEFYTFHTVKSEWKELKASPAPCARSGHQMIATAQNGGEIYLFGGEYASPSQLQFYHFRDTWRFQLATKKWEKLNTLVGPSARSGHRIVLSKKRIILFGGFHDNNNTFQYFNDVWCFSLENYAWTKVETTGTAPTARSGVIMGAKEDGNIIIHGGYTKTNAKGEAARGITHSDTFLLQEESDGKWKWTNCKTGGHRLVPRSAVSTTVGPNGKIYTFGGVMDTEEDDEDVRGQFSNEIHFLETSGGGTAWRKVELKTKKAEHGKAQTAMESDQAETKTFQDGVFTITIGGSTQSKEAESSTPKLEINGPSPRMNAGLVLVRHNLYVFGGSYEQGSRLFTLNDFHSLDINKLDIWKTHVGNMPSLAWFGSDSEDSTTDGSDGNEDSDDSSDSDEMETD